MACRPNQEHFIVMPKLNTQGLMLTCKAKCHVLSSQQNQSLFESCILKPPENVDCGYLGPNFTSGVNTYKALLSIAVFKSQTSKYMQAIFQH